MNKIHKICWIKKIKISEWLKRNYFFSPPGQYWLHPYGHWVYDAWSLKQSTTDSASTLS